MLRVYPYQVGKALEVLSKYGKDQNDGDRQVDRKGLETAYQERGRPTENYGGVNRLSTRGTLAYAAAGLAIYAALCWTVADTVRSYLQPVPIHTEERTPEETVACVETVLIAYGEPIVEPEQESEDKTPVNPSPLTESEWETLIEVCEERNIAVSLALGLIEVESNFDKNAVSQSGCYGYTQINPSFHPNGLSPEGNIRYGLSLLADLCEKYGCTEAGLCAYHDGHDTGRRWYSEKVLAAGEKWEETLNESEGCR